MGIDFLGSLMLLLTFRKGHELMHELMCTQSTVETCEHQID